MTTTSIAPLRKRDGNGKLYTRLPTIEAKLVENSSLTRDELAARCTVRDREAPEYLPSECLVYLVREHRSRPFDDCSEKLFKALLERVLRGLPQAESSDGASGGLTDGNVRDEGRYRFLQLLGKDRLEYDERLDIYEVRFQMALATLRVDAQRKIYSKDNPLETIETEAETGEISEKVERAAGTFDPLDTHPLNDLGFRLRLEKAIDALPPLQKAIVEMWRKGVLVESKEPGAVTISNSLGKTPKTIRTHKNLACATLREALTKGEQL